MESIITNSVKDRILNCEKAIYTSQNNNLPEIATNSFSPLWKMMTK